MAGAAAGGSGRGGRRRPKPLAWVVACLLLAGIVFAVASVLGGDDDEPSADPRANAPSCDLPGNHPARSALCPKGTFFRAERYLTHGDSADCVVFATQADAQAVLRANPADPNRLDPDRDGIACPELAQLGATDLKPVAASVAKFKCSRNAPRSARCPERQRSFDPVDFTRTGTDLYDCDDFASQADAQAVLRFTPTDPNRLDPDGNGVACPELRGPKDVEPVPGREAT